MKRRHQSSHTQALGSERVRPQQNDNYPTSKTEQIGLLYSTARVTLWQLPMAWSSLVEGDEQLYRPNSQTCLE